MFMSNRSGRSRSSNRFRTVGYNRKIWESLDSDAEGDGVETKVVHCSVCFHSNSVKTSGTIQACKSGQYFDGTSDTALWMNLAGSK